MARLTFITDDGPPAITSARVSEDGDFVAGHRYDAAAAST